jgi:hypothetical protein
MALSMMTLNILDLVLTPNIMTLDAQAAYCYTDCNSFCHNEAIVLSVVMMSVVILSVIMLSVIILSIIMLSVVMLSVVC